VHGVIPPQVQDAAFAFVEPHQVPLCPTFQPVEVTLNSPAMFFIQNFLTLPPPTLSADYPAVTAV